MTIVRGRSSLRTTPMTGADLRGRSALEVGVLAFCYSRALVGAEVTLRELGELPGPYGAPAGAAAAGAAVRDLAADGLLLLPGLDGAGPDTLMPVLTPGRAPRRGPRTAPPWSTGEKVFGMYLPRSLPAELLHAIRQVNAELTALHRQHPGTLPVEEHESLLGRKVEVLRSWLALVPKNKPVREEVKKTERTHADLRRQVQSRQAKVTAA